ncbi:Hypothetical protein CINCED_3A008753 [Cinara cedri]|uniref:Uncharacterized protein n=1 Tax=Cinara cedri TaxID=506608 RepID=A0A5E4MR41_9HEMI|nr:Hypothetical protein CINCED_3A008753 [Cinara cedri]
MCATNGSDINLITFMLSSILLKNKEEIIRKSEERHATSIVAADRLSSGGTQDIAELDTGIGYEKRVWKIQINFQNMCVTNGAAERQHSRADVKTSTRRRCHQHFSANRNLALQVEILTWDVSTKCTDRRVKASWESVSND